VAPSSRDRFVWWFSYNRGRRKRSTPPNARLDIMADSDHQLRLFRSVPTADTATTLRVVWVFRRQERELRVAQSEEDCRLIVSPPDAPSIQRRFTTVEALVAFQTELVSQLRREGWVLNHVEPERRSGRDRRLRTRSDPERRSLLS
jgi:hypothetical protein